MQAVGEWEPEQLEIKAPAGQLLSSARLPQLSMSCTGLLLQSLLFLTSSRGGDVSTYPELQGWLWAEAAQLLLPK